MNIIKHRKATIKNTKLATVAFLDLSDNTRSATIKPRLCLELVSPQVLFYTHKFWASCIQSISPLLEPQWTEERECQASKNEMTSCYTYCLFETSLKCNYRTDLGTNKCNNEFEVLKYG